MAETRRGFLRVLGGSALALGGRRARRARRSERALRDRVHVVRRAFAARTRPDPWRGPDRLARRGVFDLCRSFGADGCQLDIGQLDSTEPHYLDGLQAEARRGRALRRAVGAAARSSKTRSYFADVARVARALGAARLRVALLHGRRYEDFATLEAWREFADHWRERVPRAKRAIERHKLEVGIENHKDWTRRRAGRLFRSVDSPYFGACVDFGNNISLLEDPLDTDALAPYAMTTHLKDMALRPSSSGFELSEVPLGTGICRSPR